MSGPLKTEQVGACRVCSGPVLRLIEEVYRGDPMRAIAGPGSRNQIVREVAFYCDDCGIQYFKAPAA